MVGDILQPTHLIFVLVVALLVLGPKKLPEVGRQLGNGLRDFRAAINGEQAEPKEVTPSYEQPAAEHAFAHAPAQTTAEGHDVAHEATPAPADDVQLGDKPAGEHEFAYERSESADKRTDAVG